MARLVGMDSCVYLPLGMGGEQKGVKGKIGLEYGGGLGEREVENLHVASIRRLASCFFGLGFQRHAGS